MHENIQEHDADNRGHHSSGHPDRSRSCTSGSGYRPAGRYPDMDNLPLLRAGQRIAFQIISFRSFLLLFWLSTMGLDMPY